MNILKKELRPGGDGDADTDVKADPSNSTNDSTSK